MNETKTSCAPADSRNLTWDGMDWSKCDFHYYMLLDGTPLRETQDGKYEKITAEELNTRKTRAFSSANLT